MVYHSGTANARDYRQESNAHEKTRERLDVREEGRTHSGTLAQANSLESLAKALRGLSPEARARLAALLLSEQEE
jgi:hypothetical protein